MLNVACKMLVKLTLGVSHVQVHRFDRLFFPIITFEEFSSVTVIGGSQRPFGSSIILKSKFDTFDVALGVIHK
jgi:hypothetical protein